MIFILFYYYIYIFLFICDRRDWSHRIGLIGFDNPMRDNRTEEAKRQIGEGAKVRMDEKGNIHIKRVSKSNIYIKNTADENGIGNDILKLPQGALEFGKGYLVRHDK